MFPASILHRSVVKPLQVDKLLLSKNFFLADRIVHPAHGFLGQNQDLIIGSRLLLGAFFMNASPSPPIRSLSLLDTYVMTHLMHRITLATRRSESEPRRNVFLMLNKSIRHMQQGDTSLNRYTRGP